MCPPKPVFSIFELVLPKGRGESLLLKIQERDGIKPIIPETDPITILFFSPHYSLNSSSSLQRLSNTSMWIELQCLTKLTRRRRSATNMKERLGWDSSLPRLEFMLQESKADDLLLAFQKIKKKDENKPIINKQTEECAHIQIVSNLRQNTVRSHLFRALKKERSNKSRTWKGCEG
jgi:hypothetical protein